MAKNLSAFVQQQKLHKKTRPDITKINQEKTTQKGLEKMKKSTFGLIATAAFILTPVAAFAQDSQQNLQINNSNAAAVGEGNFINQTTDQYSNQTQLGVNGYGYYEPSSQMSVQDNLSEAAAVGEYNTINQGTVQENGQTNVGIDSYYPQY